MRVEVSFVDKADACVLKLVVKDEKVSQVGLQVNDKLLVSDIVSVETLSVSCLVIKFTALLRAGKLDFKYRVGAFGSWAGSTVTQALLDRVESLRARQR